jgi:hypothetical protein
MDNPTTLSGRPAALKLPNSPTFLVADGDQPAPADFHQSFQYLDCTHA